MSDAAHSRVDDLKRAAAIANRTRRVDDAAFQIGLLALNSIIIAAQVGDWARGFSATSARMRELSGALKRTMAHLSEGAHEVVRTSASLLKRERHARVMRCAGLSLDDEAERELRRQLAEAEQQIALQIEELEDQSRVGFVISRTAMIEAAHCPLTPNPLEHLAEEFSKSIEGMIDLLRGLRTLTRRTRP